MNWKFFKGEEVLARTVQFRFVETRDSRIGSVKSSMQETGKSLFAMDGVQIFSLFGAFVRMDAVVFLREWGLRMSRFP
ncbi:hypothetical protein, partial [Pseudomonas sp. FW306-2-11BA]|uniref:hypothetical protein n=1 Tax=Pseudomonas sp. FW306-2-11BA TaxID=2070662 RepID=UPI001C47A5A8